MNAPMFASLAEGYLKSVDKRQQDDFARHVFFSGAACALDILMAGSEEQRRAVMREIAAFLQAGLMHCGPN